MNPHSTDDRRALDDALFAGPAVSEEPIPSYTYPDDDVVPPALARAGDLHAAWGEAVPITADTLALAGPDPVLIDVMVLSAPTKGALLRDGFALTGGDAFTQEDIDRGRIAYRHDGEQPGDDRFSFATPAGEVPPTDIRVVIPEPPGKGPEWHEEQPGDDALSYTTAVEEAPPAGAPGVPERGDEQPGDDRLSAAAPAEEVPPAEPDAATEPPRQAPELHGPGTLDGVLQGRRVGDLAGLGIAVVAAAGRGRWERRDGDGWAELPDAQHGAAVLLGPDDCLRFIPRSGWSGTVKLTYRLWDGSGHAAGEAVNLSAKASYGGATAFSAEVGTVTLAVEAVAKPVRPEPPAPWLTPTRVRDITGEGLAMVRLEGPGTWHYSLDEGRTWREFGSVYHGRARLLGPGDRVRFVPRPGARGKVVLGCRAWDASDPAGGTLSLATARSVGDRSPFGDSVLTLVWRI